ncbi:MAG: DUF1189 domain-containing protein [Nitrospirae bacterium]|nr:DUF1189 domain-containing protein [Nitrospirota bacterium]
MTQNKTTGIYSSIQAVYLSFYSRELYQDVARNWNGLCLPYLFFTLMLFWIPETMNMHRTVSDFLADEGPNYVEQIPVITIAKGEVSIKEEMPFTIYDKKNKTPFAIIDTTGKTTSLDNSPAHVLVTKNALIVRKDEKEVRSLPLSDVGDTTITKTLIYEWIEIIKNLILAVFFPLILLLSFGFHIMQVILLSFLGGNFAKYFHVNLGFRTLIRLSAVAFTPPLLLEAVHAILDIAYPYSSLMSFIIAAGYLYYAVGSNSEKMLNPIRNKP